MAYLNELIRRVEQAGGNLAGCKIQSNTQIYRYRHLSGSGQASVNYGSDLSYSGVFAQRINVLRVEFSLVKGSAFKSSVVIHVE